MEEAKILATATPHLMSDNPSQLQVLQQQLKTERQARRIAEEKVDYYARQLEDAQNEMASFTHWLSHDLRTPLRAISGFSQILTRREEDRRYFDHISKSSNQMEQLIQDLLDYYRLGQQPIQTEPIRLHDMLMHITKKLVLLISETNAEIHYPSADEQHVFFSDWSLVETILTQLLKNALTYHRANVRLSITVSSQFRNNHIFIRVHNNGIGIANEFQRLPSLPSHQDILTPFQTLHHGKDYPGSRIGLASVKKAVDLLAGEVWVESKLAEGNIFVVQLPN